MAFESFEHVTEVNGFAIDKDPQNPTGAFIKMDADNRTIEFKMQCAPVGEVGLEGVQQVEMIKLALEQIKYFQGKLPCRENAIAITHLETALLWLEERKRNRIERGVEGYDKD